MSDTLESLRRKIDGAAKLKSVVRTMKAIAASSIGQYETAMRSLDNYEHTVTLGLTAALRSVVPPALTGSTSLKPSNIGAIIFGSDQGLIGQFNELIAQYAIEKLGAFSGRKSVWIVGERLHARLADSGMDIAGVYSLPNSVTAITRLVGQIQLDCEARRAGYDFEDANLRVFHNMPKSAGQFTQVSRHLLPLDAKWQARLSAAPWPGHNLPEAIGPDNEALRALIREYLFISLFKACAESLASENASRLTAMQRAEKSIDTMSERLGHQFHQLRQSAIDAELFDVTAGFDALGTESA